MLAAVVSQVMQSPLLRLPFHHFLFTIQPWEIAASVWMQGWIDSSYIKATGSQITCNNKSWQALLLSNNFTGHNTGKMTVHSSTAVTTDFSLYTILTLMDSYWPWTHPHPTSRLPYLHNSWWYLNHKLTDLPHNAILSRISKTGIGKPDQTNQ